MKSFILASSLILTLSSLDWVNARSAKLSPFGLSASSTSASSFSNGGLPEALLNLASVRTSDEGRQLRQKPRRRPVVQQFPTLQKPRRRVQVVNKQNVNQNRWPIYRGEDEFGADNLLRTQGAGDFDESLNEVDVYAIDPDNLPEGYVCMNKTYDVSTYEHENQIQCSHVWQKSCFTIQATVFKPVEQDECEDHFEEECTITNEDVARSEKVRRCTQPFKRDCEKEGEEVCTIEYETVCDTKYIANNVTDKIAQCETTLNEDGIPVRKCEVVEEENIKYSPQVECRQEEQEVCGPEPCPLVKGEEECRETYEQKIISVPVSDCSLTPRTTCSKVTRIVPNLVPQNKCMQVPKEVCSTVRVATKQIVEPATKLWCGPSQTSSNKRPGKPKGPQVASKLVVAAIENGSYVVELKHFDQNNTEMFSCTNEIKEAYNIRTTAQNLTTSILYPKTETLIQCGIINYSGIGTANKQSVCITNLNEYVNRNLVFKRLIAFPRQGIKLGPSQWLMVTDMREESGEQEITIINDENALQRVSPNLPNLKLDAECMIPFNKTHTVIKAWRDNRVYFFNSENSEFAEWSEFPIDLDTSNSEGESVCGSFISANNNAVTLVFTSTGEGSKCQKFSVDGDANVRGIQDCTTDMEKVRKVVGFESEGFRYKMIPFLRPDGDQSTVGLTNRNKYLLVDSFGMSVVDSQVDSESITHFDYAEFFGPQTDLEFICNAEGTWPPPVKSSPK